VTGRIHKLVELARAEKDHATVNLLNWFVDEQVEEEANFESILGRIQIAGDRGAALLFLDKELGKRADG
jgi:ferritin